MEYITLTILWSLWCLLHSLLITPSVTNLLKEKLKKSYTYFRIFYNIFATLTFVGVSYYAKTIHDSVLFSPNGYQQIIQLILFVISILLFVMGTKNYDMMQFLGLMQIKQENNGQGIGVSGEFKQSGILRYTRHPWYLASFLILWSGYIDLTYTRFIMNAVFTLYLFVGTILEEKKMVDQFGESYRTYQKKVPMFIGLKSFQK